MTGRELVTAALKKLGVIASGETLDAADAVDALSELNRMISSWSNDSLMVFSRVRETVTLVASDESYTVGSSGDLNTTRPQKIDQLLLRDETQSPAVEYPIQILSLDEWTRIVQKDVNGIPVSAWIDDAYPLMVVNLYPRPSTTYKLVVWSQKPLTEIATLDTSISLPPGYEDALLYNLAVRLSPDYGIAVREDVVAIAAESRAKLEVMNMKPIYLKMDGMLTAGGRGYDITKGPR